MPLSTQGFTYAHANPTRFTDPDGRLSMDAGASFDRLAAAQLQTQAACRAGSDEDCQFLTGQMALTTGLIVLPVAIMSLVAMPAQWGLALSAVLPVATLAHDERGGTVIADPLSATFGVIPAIQECSEGSVTACLSVGVDVVAAIWGVKGWRAQRRAAAPARLPPAAEATITHLVDEAPRCVGCGGPSCFVAGTPVQTPNGEVPIEQIQEDDVVISWDETTNTWQEGVVVRTFVTLEQEVLQVSFDDGVDAIEATPEHPWFVEGRGWTSTRELQVGDLVPSSHGGWLRVSGTTWQQERETVYNFEVEGTHTYAVGEAGALVHNTCGVDWKDLPLGVQISRQGDFWVKRVNPGASRVMQFLGRRSLDQNSRALTKLGDLATENFMRDGMLNTRHVGQLMSEAGGTSNPLFWQVFRAVSKRMGIINDIRPRNMGANGLIFDAAHPIRDPYIAGAAAAYAAATAFGAGWLMGG